MYDTVELFKALGDLNRLRIIKLLYESGSSLCVGMLARTLHVTQPAISQHLRILRTAGIVEGRKTGYHIHYGVRTEPFEKYGLEISRILKFIDIPPELEGRS